MRTHRCLIAPPRYGEETGHTAASLARRTRSESNFFAFSNSARRSAVKPFPPILRKYVSIRKPETGPLGETFFDASDRAMTLALFVNRPSGG